MVISFAVQGASHFAINKAHFDSIGFMRKNPILPIGVSVMAFQGLLASLALATWRGEGASLVDGMIAAGAFGSYLLGYIAFVEPSKYTVPSVAAWGRVEGLAGIVQFTLFGVALGLIHQMF